MDHLTLHTHVCVHLLILSSMVHGQICTVFFANKNKQLTPALAVSLSCVVRGKYTFTWQMGTWAFNRKPGYSVSQFLLKQELSARTFESCLPFFSPLLFFQLDASFACSGYKHRAKGGGTPSISGPLRPPGGIEVWRTSVFGTACVSVFSVCLWGHLYANAKQPIGVANYKGTFVCARH